MLTTFVLIAIYTFNSAPHPPKIGEKAANYNRLLKRIWGGARELP